jgi:hypothetical protein
MKSITIFCSAILLAVSAAQAQPRPAPILATRLPNGTYSCPAGTRGPIQPNPGGAWVCFP